MLGLWFWLRLGLALRGLREIRKIMPNIFDWRFLV
jgi:hypothetical protein